jgi:hypothetical protein
MMPPPINTTSAVCAMTLSLLQCRLSPESSRQCRLSPESSRPVGHPEHRAVGLPWSRGFARLVAVFKYSHETPAQLVYAACIGLMTALLVAWGLFVRLNQSAGQLEPEALEQTKQEDRNVQ